MGSEAHPHSSGKRDPPGLHLIVLMEELDGVQNDTIPEKAAFFRMEYPGGDLVEDELLVPDVDGVTGVGPSLEPGDDVGLLGQDVHDLPLPFVSPLPTYHYRAATSVQAFRHGVFGSFQGPGSRSGTPAVRPKKKALLGGGPLARLSSGRS